MRADRINTTSLRKAIAIVSAAIVMTTTVGGVSAFTSLNAQERAAQAKAEADSGDVITYEVTPGERSLELAEDTKGAIILSSSRSIANANGDGTVQIGSIGTAELNIVQIRGQSAKGSASASADLETGSADGRDPGRKSSADQSEDKKSSADQSSDKKFSSNPTDPKTPARIIVKVANQQSLATDKESYAAVYGDKPFVIHAKTNAREGNRITYESEDPKIAEVNARGKVTVKSAGRTAIRIHAAGSESFHDAQISVPVEISKAEQEISVKEEEYSISITDEKTKIEASAQTDHDIIYESKDPSIAEVDQDGTVHPVKTGKTEIILSQKGTKNYESAKAKVSLEIREPDVQERIDGAIAWAVDIAGDNSFTYGTGSAAHRAGCYFCGTNSRKKPSGYEKTYCCNPFIYAAYAHGAEDPAILAGCQRGQCGGMDPSDWPNFRYVGSTKEVPYSDLLPGDVILSDKTRGARYHHVWMYIGDDKIVESSGGGWDAGSIAVKNDAPSKYKSYQRNGCDVIRYIGPEDARQ